MRKKVIALIFIIAVISFLIITLPAFLEQNSNSQQELVDSETGTSVSLSTTDITEDKITSIYENVNYIDNETFNKIKEAYNRIDFDVSFNAGNVETYDFYKKQFNRLLKNEVMFTDTQTGEKYYLKQYGFFSLDVEIGEYDLNNYTYYFFDMDGDESPELCISDKASFTYIMKYDKDLDQFTLWQRYETPSIFLMGTKKIGNSGNARYAFFILDEKGEYNQFLWFKVEGYTDSQSKKDTYCFMVTLPQYINQYDQDELTDHMRDQAVLDENQDLYYFRVTEKQFNELTNDYFKAVELAGDVIKDVTFTYEEMFGE